MTFPAIPDAAIGAIAAASIAGLRFKCRAHELHEVKPRRNKSF